MSSERVCSFEGCGGLHFGKGFCNGHYSQKVRGKTLTPLRVKRDGTTRNGRGEKECGKCHNYRPTDQFYKQTASKDGLQPGCIPCTKIRGIETRYGITFEEYTFMLKEQEGVCAICKKADGTTSLAVDHDHSCCPGPKSCGKCVRKLLCKRCNMGIGLLGDNKHILESALHYLESNGKVSGTTPADS